jgi:hypothetical protein
LLEVAGPEAATYNEGVSPGFQNNAILDVFFIAGIACTKHLFMVSLPGQSNVLIVSQGDGYTTHTFARLLLNYGIGDFPLTENE